MGFTFRTDPKVNYFLSLHNDPLGPSHPHLSSDWCSNFLTILPSSILLPTHHLLYARRRYSFKNYIMSLLCSKSYKRSSSPLDEESEVHTKSYETSMVWFLPTILVPLSSPFIPLLFFAPAKHTPSSGPFHLLFALPGMLLLPRYIMPRFLIPHLREAET